MPSLLRSRWLWVGSGVSWCAIALFIFAQQWISARASGRFPSPRELLLHLESLGLWAVMTPFIIAIAERLRLERGRRAVSLAAHAVAALSFACLDVTLDGILLAPLSPAIEPWPARAIGEAFINCYSYVAVTGVGYALIYARALAEDHARTAELQRRFAEARLAALTAKLRPHFLFNALNAVAALIRLGEPTQALGALVGLSDLLRVVVTLDGDARVPLTTELSWVERYFAIERLRFQDRLRTEVVVSADAGAALVPALILQPIVENAIRHGLEQRRGRGTVAVQAQRSGDFLSLVIRDEAEPSAAPLSQPGFGIGLEATRERLAHLYGPDRYSLDLTQSSQGSRACIQIPFVLQEP